MKKFLSTTLLSIITLSLVLTGCSSSSDTMNSTAESVTNDTSATLLDITTPSNTTVASSEDTSNNLNALRFYMVNESKSARTLATQFTGPWNRGTDIASFEVYATKESSISGANFKKVWESYWNQYSNSSNYKIGYYLSFDLISGDNISKTIKFPTDVFEFRDYLEVYLYDDINQIQGNWYSHLLESEVDSDTMITSIKLTPGVKISEVKDGITLKVFAYTGDQDFDSVTGQYIGTISYEIKVNKSK